MKRLYRTPQHRGMHGSQHVADERKNALLMMRTALTRVAVWMVMILLFIAPIPAIRHLYSLTAFITILSLLALLLTDWGQYASSKAQFAAVNAHADAEHTRAALAGDTTEIELDLARLADLQPGPDAIQLAEEIRAKLGT